MEPPEQFLQQFLTLEQVPVQPKSLKWSYPKKEPPGKVSANKDPKEQVQVKKEHLEQFLMAQEPLEQVLLD